MGTPTLSPPSPNASAPSPSFMTEPPNARAASQTSKCDPLQANAKFSQNQKPLSYLPQHLMAGTCPPPLPRKAISGPCSCIYLHHLWCTLCLSEYVRGSQPMVCGLTVPLGHITHNRSPTKKEQMGRLVEPFNQVAATTNVPVSEMR